MKKSKIFPQLSVLAAGTFANIIMAILFGLILWLFFAAAFTPAGVQFNTYSADLVNVSAISGLTYFTMGNTTLARVSTTDNKTYIATSNMLDILNKTKPEQVALYDDSPALNAKLVGAITEINNQKIKTYQQLNQTLKSFNPRDNITITTITSDKQRHSYNIQLAEKNGKAFLGIGIAPYERSGIIGKFYNLIAKVKDPLIYYESKLGDFGIFVSDLLWWIVLISFSVALMNMLPAGMFDGGRFFYLTVLAITKKKEIAEKAFKLSTWILLGILALLLLKWLFAMF
jgi:membrane-associated protease RseP (regulator of RpoE activity)